MNAFDVWWLAALATAAKQPDDESAMDAFSFYLTCRQPGFSLEAHSNMERGAVLESIHALRELAR